MKPIILKKTKKLISACVAFTLFGIQPGYANTYYVATTGNNSYTSAQAQNEATPWKTIQKAANTLIAGDTVYVREGSYKEQVTPKNSGNASKYIIYTTYPGETVIVDGANSTFSFAGMFEIKNRSYIQISGFRVINSPAFGIQVSYSRNIKILSNYTYNTRNSGIRMGDSDSITVDENEIEFASNGGDQNNGIQECLSFHKTPNSIASNNIIHNCGMESIDFKVASSNGRIFGNNIYNSARIGIYVDGYSENIDNVEVYNNIVHDSKPVITGSGDGGIIIAAERGMTMSNIKVYNNIVYNISGTGIGLSDYHEADTPNPTYTSISIYNNTIYNTGTKVNNPWGGGGIFIPIPVNAAISGIIIRNNIMSKCPLFNISAPPITTISNNLFHSGSASGTSQVMGNPLFVYTAANDFHLQSTSPAINAGFAAGAPTSDFDGTVRIGNADIGAYEYSSQTGIVIKKN